MLVEVLHPAHVRHRPRGGRSPRETLAETRSPATLRTARPDELAPGPRVRLAPLHQGHLSPSEYERRCWSAPTYLREGIPYLPLSYTDACAGRTGLPLDAFLRFLRGELGQGSQLAGCDEAFSGTPLRELAGYPSLADSPEWGRGAVYDPGRQLEVAHDGRGAAAAALAAFLDAEILVADDAVLRRFRPLLRVSPEYGHPWQVPATGRPDPLHGTPAFPLGEIERAAGFFPVLLRKADLPHARAAAAALRESFPQDCGDACAGDADLRIGIPSIAGSAARWLRAAEREGRGRDDRDAVSAEASGFAALHMALRIGQDPACGWPEAVRRIRRAIDVAAVALPPRRVHEERVRLAGAYLDFAGRRLAAAPPAADDAEALAGLAPG